MAPFFYEVGPETLTINIEFLLFATERKNKLIKVIGKFYDHVNEETSEIYQELIFKKRDQQKVNLLM